MNRRQNLWALFDFTSGHGLEIGPLHDPIARRVESDVKYVDVFGRDHLVANYADNPVVRTERIPEIDFVLTRGDRVVSIPEAIGAERFDWVMASHVIEHVPDLVGWLEQIAQVVVDGGALVLAVPDRRYCFDLHRPGTSFGQVLQAHELGETVPSVRAVWDHRRGLVTVAADKLWAGEVVGRESRAYTRDSAVQHVERARRGEYLDSHVWLFTPGSLLEQLIELRELGLSEWRVEAHVPTVRDQHEFFMVLRRLPRGGAWDPTILAAEPQPGPVPDWLAETSADRRELLATKAEAARLRKRVATLEKRDRARVGYRVKARARALPGFTVLRRARRAGRRLARAGRDHLTSAGSA